MKRNYKSEITKIASIFNLLDKAKMWVLRLKMRNGLKKSTNEQLEHGYDAMNQAISITSNMSGEGGMEGPMQEAIKNFENARDDILQEMQNRNMGVQQLTGGKPYYIKR